MLRTSPAPSLPELESLSTAEYCESWLSQVRGRVRGRTYAGYAGLLRRYALPFIGELPLAEPAGHGGGVGVRGAQDPPVPPLGGPSVVPCPLPRPPARGPGQEALGA